MIEIGDLVKRAKEACSQESVATVFRNRDCEIWVGIWIRKKNTADVFTAASIRLGFSEDCSVDLERLTKTVGVLHELQELGYGLYYCGNGSIYVERETNRKDVNKHVDEMLELLAIETSDFILMVNQEID